MDATAAEDPQLLRSVVPDHDPPVCEHGGAAESSTAPASIQGDMFRAGPVGENAALVREQATAPGEVADEAGGPGRYG